MGIHMQTALRTLARRPGVAAGRLAMVVVVVAIVSAVLTAVQNWQVGASPNATIMLFATVLPEFGAGTWHLSAGAAAALMATGSAAILVASRRAASVDLLTALRP